MAQQRVICFIDGFNLYHAIDKLNKPHLKWVNLKNLASVFIRSRSQKLIDVYYFSAYANWLIKSKERHVQYVKALHYAGVKLIIGKFKSKSRKCPKCEFCWNGYEEKNTSVNIAITLLNLAYKNEYDHAHLISNDSDLVPIIHAIKDNFPKKIVTIISPPHYYHSNELIKASSNNKAKIKVHHLKRCLFPKNILDDKGKIITTCPKEYIKIQ